MSNIKYTDIGHSHPNDILWLWSDLNLGDARLVTMPAGLSRTHELVWGGDVTITKHWRGRIENSTGRCSIAPPEGIFGPASPHMILRELHCDFNVEEFYYFDNSGIVYYGVMDVIFEPMDNSENSGQKI